MAARGGYDDLEVNLIVDHLQANLEVADGDVCTSLGFSQGRGDTLQVGRDPAQLLLAQTQRFGRALYFRRVVDRVVPAILPIPSRFETLFRSVELLARLLRAYAGFVERIGQLADLARRTALDGLVQEPRVTPGGISQCEDVEMPQGNTHQTSAKIARRCIYRRTARLVLVHEDACRRVRIAGQRFEC